jgi:hypothetical protein
MWDPGFSGFYTLWYASPVAFVVGGASGLTGSIPWAFCFNEMGKDFTLNSPAAYCFGGKIDGGANAIISESLGGIFEIATSYELLNHGPELGLGSDLEADIRNSALGALAIIVANYVNYTNTGSAFHSWNSGSGPDPTIDTFSSISYKFIQHAEQAGQGYRIPLKRLMQALELFNSNWLSSFDPSEDTPAADSFRATLWVAALSYAFQTDLRGEFEALNFPVSDTTYASLSAQMAALPDIIDLPHRLQIQDLPSYGPTPSINGPLFRFYGFQFAPTLSPLTWNYIGNGFVASTNGLWLDSSSNRPVKYYRSEMLP